jgi:ectoine hydroxylase-related dioxygenase (phytanoyl-CoA dioxygenase family)
MRTDADTLLSQLDDQGYCIVPDAIDVETVKALSRDLDPVFEATPFSNGDFYGRRTKRFGGLLKRSARAEALVRHPLALELANRVLGSACDRIALNLTQGIEIFPGAPLQYPHRDQDMWQGAKGAHEYLINVMWPLSRFTTDNGATMLWPNSHRGEQPGATADEAIAIEMEPGSMLIFLGSTLHGGGENRSKQVRRGLIVSYCLGWLKPFENQWLVYPPDIARHFDPELAALIGYAQHRPNLGNVEGQCPSRLLGSSHALHVAATDALRPDQAEALETFVAGGSRLP